MSEDLGSWTFKMYFLSSNVKKQNEIMKELSTYFSRIYKHALFSCIQSATAEFKLPLVTVRPECAGILRDLPMDEPKLSPASHSISPFFMEDDDPEKFIKKG